MPIYEYACDKCHMKEEFIQKFDAAAPESCPHCNAKGSLKKVVTSSSFHLKGGGWYKDLYASKKPAESPSQSKPSSDADKSAKPPVKKDD